jgi:hypothetical protein
LNVALALGAAGRLGFEPLTPPVGPAAPLHVMVLHVWVVALL